MPNPLPDVDTIVIGAGVVGLAIAAALAQRGHEVIVLERESSIGQGVSSRNSEVIHAGIYYPPGSLKSEVCVSGKQLLYEYCNKRGIGAEQKGKLIVASDDEDKMQLHRLHRNAGLNGVHDTKIISADDAQALQPGLQCVAALHSPSTGIVDSHALMVSLAGDIERHGGTIVCRTQVESIVPANRYITITDTENTSVTARQVINSCGLNAVSMGQCVKTIPDATIPKARFAKGSYFKLEGKSPFTMLVYPAPVTGGLGIHLTVDLAGQARFGPDVEWLEDVTEPDDYKVDPSRAQSFYAAIRRYWPQLPDNSLVPDYAGIRPKIIYPDQRSIDFEISAEQDHGIPGLGNLYGIESPGLTSSLAIAAQVCNRLGSRPKP